MHDDQAPAAPSSPVDPTPDDVKEERDPRPGLDRELTRRDDVDELTRRDEPRRQEITSAGLAELDAPAGAGDLVEAYRG